MSFRTRLLLGILIAVLLPLAALALGVRREMERRLTGEYERRVGAMAALVEADLAQESATIATRLTSLAADLSRNNRFRLAVLQADPSSRRYLLDYAADAMKLSGLSMLQVQDSTGRILSSGHFRNEFDQRQPALPRLLGGARGPALVRTRTPEAPMLVLARVDSFGVGGRIFNIVGGVTAEARLLDGPARGSDISVALILPGTQSPDSGSSRVIRALALPYVDLLTGSAPTLDSAAFLVTGSLNTLRALQQSVDRWFLLALALTVAAALTLAAWVSSRISRPISELARKTSEIDLDRLDQSFESDRTDELGALSRLLGAMTERLRTSSARLREAERKAAMGELAQQVNHDIKNGLAPIRNVLRHFSQVASQEPGLLASVYEERKGTLQSSVEYLETLARNYARLSPGIDRAPCDVNALVEEVLRHTSADGTALHTDLNRQIPPALGDSLLIRRILENLVGNAVDSLAGQAGGRVMVTTGVTGREGEASRVRIRVSDTGRGMTRPELERAFDDFYTTKAHGTGLGLSIVRRLVLDLNGSLHVETEPGAGTSFVVELPAAPKGLAA